MPRYIIEREIPEAGKLSPEQLRAISQKSCGVLAKMGSPIQWLESYVTDDKIYCVYIAPNEQAVREHAKQGGFPANRVSRVLDIIDPTTAEPELIFSKLVDVGTNGDAAESGLGTTYAALVEHGDGDNAGFYREEAAFHAVVVSDEDDYTPEDYLSLGDFETWLFALKGGRLPVTFSSIVNPVGCECTGPESPGIRYIAATNAVGGTVWDLHDPDGWDAVLDDIANSLTNLASEFYLSRRPALATLDIHIDDGTAIPVPLGEGVEYDPEEWLARLRAGAPASEFLLRRTDEPVSPIRGSFAG